MSEPLLRLSNLSVALPGPAGATTVVRNLDLDVSAGEVMALVGESGSGKTQAMLAAMGLSPQRAKVSGSVTFEGKELVGLKESELNTIRGGAMTMIFQEPMSALDPLTRVGEQIAAPLRVHAGLSRRAARDRAACLLAETKVKDAPLRLDDYPHQLSGGERQRAMIAMAIANAPKLIIADEPTTALDAAVQLEILALLAELRRRREVALLIVTHDLGLVRKVAERVAVMRAGEIVERGTVRDVFARPEAEYTRRLVEAEPKGEKAPPSADAGVVLDAVGVRVTYRRRSGLFEPKTAFAAVDGVDLKLRRGETLALVGESGSGKSTLARALLKLVKSEGSVAFEGGDLSRLSREALRALRRRMQLVFQDPFGSLSPLLSVGAIVAEGLLTHEPGLSSTERDRRVADILESVGIDPRQADRTPDAFSGGQRQRIAIARALVLKPTLLVLDEPTSALDRSVQREILELLRRVQADFSLTYLLITHDLKVARAMADTIAVMRAGKIVERGKAQDVFERPKSDYAKSLIAAASMGDVTG